MDGAQSRLIAAIRKRQKKLLADALPLGDETLRRETEGIRRPHRRLLAPQGRQQVRLDRPDVFVEETGSELALPPKARPRAIWAGQWVAAPHVRS